MVSKQAFTASKLPIVGSFSRLIPGTILRISGTMLLKQRGTMTRSALPKE
jgi:hypothetical protein